MLILLRFVMAVDFQTGSNMPVDYKLQLKLFERKTSKAQRKGSGRLKWKN